MTTVAEALRLKGNDIVTVGPSTPVMEIATTISDRKIGAVVVVDSEMHLLGIVSERDIVRALARHGMAVSAMTAERLMTRNVTTATPQTSINQAMKLMDDGYFRHLPIVVDGKLEGIISIRDVVKFEMMLQKSDLESLTAYIARQA